MVLAIRVLIILFKVSLKYKLILFITSLLLIVILFLSNFVLDGIKKYQGKETEQVLLKQKDMFEQYFYEKSNGYGKDTNIKVEVARGNMFNKPWLRTIPANIYDTNGVLLSGFRPDGNFNDNSEKDLMIKNAIEDKISYKEINNIIYFYSPIKFQEELVAILELQYSNKANVDFYNNIKNMFFTIGALTLGLGIVIGFIYFFKLTNDLYKMRKSVENIEKGDYDNIKKIRRRDELGDLNNGLIFMSKTIKDNIEEIKKEKDSLNKAVTKLEKMDMQQKEFIRNVTHEFKTPITSIKAYADVINMYKDDITLIDNGTYSISKECDRLTSMVDKVLSLSSMEKYEFEIKKGEINLKSLLEQITSRMMGKISKNELTLKCDFEDITVIGDEENLKHIIINLLDNAIKYNKPKGSINVSSYKKEDSFIIEVVDTGIGISKDDITKIFEPFYRVDSHRSRETGGTGLGLALVKTLVEKQKGTLDVVSTLGKGTKFSLTFKGWWYKFYNIKTKVYIFVTFIYNSVINNWYYNKADRKIGLFRKDTIYKNSWGVKL